MFWEPLCVLNQQRAGLFGCPNPTGFGQRVPSLPRWGRGLHRDLHVLLFLAPELRAAARSHLVSFFQQCRAIFRDSVCWSEH